MASDEEIPDPPMHGLQSKGLKKGSVSLIGAVAIGLAATEQASRRLAGPSASGASAGRAAPVSTTGGEPP